MAKAAKRLGEVLIEMQIISAAEVNRALEHAKAKNLRVGEALIDLKLASESNVYKALALQHGMEYVDLDKGSVPPDQLSRIPEELMKKYLVLPLGQENGKLRVATQDGPGRWTTHAWIKQAVLLYFGIAEMTVSHAGPIEFFDKVPLKHGLDKAA